uniref:Uncharacterized protein n=1 Tax=Anguilla anguilla TaxID=7936 RepID=A0A0E9VPD7_ANGAN
MANPLPPSKRGRPAAQGTTRWIWSPNWGRPSSSPRPLLRRRWAGATAMCVIVL